MRTVRYAALALTVVCGACTRVPDTTAKAALADTAALSMDSVWIGRLVVTGTAEIPAVMLERAGETALQLSGDHVSELRALDGAEIRIIGAPAAPGVAGAGIDVERYEIIAIAGEAPFVGVLNADGAALELTDGTMLQLMGFPAPLRLPGAKVWVTGERAADTLRVRSAGNIRR